jgi:nicotinate-nucleotide adenylyltransferase
MKRGADVRLSPRARIGVFGGTFDPPHRGHVSVASDVADALQLDSVLWIPARRSPLKPEQPLSPAAVRLEMVQAAAEADPRFVVDGRELKRPPPSYTMDTLAELRREYGADAELFLIIGIDQYRALDEWHEPERVRSLCTIAVMDRAGEGIEAAEGIEAEEGVVAVRVGRVDVSSTAVRARVAEGGSIEGMVPPGVAEIIRREGLYRG